MLDPQACRARVVLISHRPHVTNGAIIFAEPIGVNMKQITGPDGNQYQTSDVEVLESTERWSEYKLSDGSTVRVKQVLTQISRVEGEHDATGNPVYMIAAQPVVSVSATDESLKRKD